MNAPPHEIIGVSFGYWVRKQTYEYGALADGWEQLSEALRQTAETMRAYRTHLDRWRRVAAHSYRRETGRRAPGSEQTRRLRKKREKALERWEATP